MSVGLLLFANFVHKHRPIVQGGSNQKRRCRKMLFARGLMLTCGCDTIQLPPQIRSQEVFTCIQTPEGGGCPLLPMQGLGNQYLLILGIH